MVFPVPAVLQQLMAMKTFMHGFAPIELSRVLILRPVGDYTVPVRNFPKSCFFSSGPCRF